MKQKKVKTTFIICALLLFSTNCLAQYKNEFSIQAGFLQLKDAFNQGMVYNGAQMTLQYQRNRFFEKWELRYKPKIAVGYIVSMRVMDAANFRVIPIDFSGLVPVYQNEKHKVSVGMNVATDYNFQNYFDQHDTHLFWYSEIGISPCFEYTYQWKQSKIKLFLQNSLLGFVSHTEEIGHYFFPYSIKFADFFKAPHHNMKFGSFDKYEHLNASIEYVPNISKKHSVALGMEYMDCYYNNHFQSLNYYLQWKISF
ncbi:MAG: hypothetical protein FWF65_09860 [Bacteroidetes bacterium]|nr:hypothetical protein [Bacteroidota bacterium]MCL1969830.1 hypothetical protein [Bacteroidota bacterium]